MSPEYRVEIVAPYIYRVPAENEEAAAEKAWRLFEDGDQGVDPLAPAEVERVEEMNAEHGGLVDGSKGARRPPSPLVGAKARDADGLP